MAADALGLAVAAAAHIVGNDGHFGIYDRTARTDVTVKWLRWPDALFLEISRTYPVTIAVDGADAVGGEGAALDSAAAGREGGPAASLPVPPGLDLDAIRARAAAATLGPWSVVEFDDAHCMCAVGVTTRPGSDDHQDVVALTLYQEPRVACHAERRWDEDAEFIAHAREDVPALVAEVERLRTLARDLAEILQREPIEASSSPGSHPRTTTNTPD